MVPIVGLPSGEVAPDWDGMTAYGQAMRARVERTFYGNDAIHDEDALHA